MDKILAIVIPICISATVIIMLISMTQCTERMQQQSKELASECISSGGSWISSNSNGMCIKK